jgi:hypothetical protein
MRLYTCIFIINLLFGFSLLAQETPDMLESEAQQQDAVFTGEVSYEGTLPSDSLAQDNVPEPQPEEFTTYGLRVGGDVSKLIRTALDDQYSGFELVGDLRFSKRFYAAAELGYEERLWSEQDLEASFNGSYLKIGADFNAYRNWTGMQNAITTGLRYGISSFSSNLLRYPIYTTDPTFPSSIREDNIEFNGLTAGWVEFILAIKTELWSNVYLSLNLQLKHLLHEDEPGNFANLVIPGFNKTNDFSAFGVGYGYTLTYFIPVLKR